MLNLLMGLVFIIMDVIFYDSCFLGLTLVKSVPATLFVLGISQMSLSLIAPAFSHFLKNKHLHLRIQIPLFQTSKSTVYLFASLMVALGITVMMIFVMLAIAFASTNNTCHQALVLFTQITCSLYIVAFVVTLIYLLFKKRDIPAFHNHFETFKTKPVEERSPAYETFNDNNPFNEHPDNLSEVHLGDNQPPNSAKAKAFTTRNAVSSEMIFARYICVVIAVIWIIASVPGIPILASGAVFYNRCPNYRRVPEWLIAHEHLEEVYFALAATHLNDNDGLWNWRGICHSSYQQAIELLMVAILQGIQLRILQSNAGLSPHSGLHMEFQDLLFQSSKGGRYLVTFCHMIADEISQFRDGLNVDVFRRVIYKDKTRQSGQQFGHFYLCQNYLQRTDYIYNCLYEKICSFCPYGSPY
ncbi:uncharacterized protein [Palaemon carinicauda]|uniref:uncharacterized protein n=1 Tax=Palaemon carinicauda TaxID=392227 RepID=UPI0035B57DF4